jgi:hypothetical protein
VFAYGSVWLFSSIVGAFGFADGGPPNIVPPLILYGLACAVWLVVDMVRYRRRAVERERAEVEQAERERARWADEAQLGGRFFRADYFERRLDTMYRPNFDLR